MASHHKRDKSNRAHIQVFHTARTAHLERISHYNSVGRPRCLFFRDRSYDWDEELAHTSRAQRVSYVALARTVLLGEASVIEINEPGFVKSLPLATVTVVCARLGRLVRPTKKRPDVVFYAIENLDPLTSLRNRLRARGIAVQALGVLVTVMVRALIPFVLRHADRVAFGTTSARQVYERYTSDTAAKGNGPKMQDFLEIPAKCNCGPLSKTPRTLLFVGEFSARKGIREMLSLWTAVDDHYLERGKVSFIFVGKGELQQEIEEWAGSRANATVVVDPPTPVIHQHYRAATVTFLLSQGEPVWREQVGLPIKDAVGHGCLVVTTSATGLAGWLEDHGHVILETPLSNQQTAQVIRAIEAQRSAHRSVEDLPATDGREQADRWLHKDYVA